MFSTTKSCFLRLVRNWAGDLDLVRTRIKKKQDSCYSQKIPFHPQPGFLVVPVFTRLDWVLMVAKKSVFLGNVRKKCKEKMITQTLPKGTSEEQATGWRGRRLGDWAGDWVTGLKRYNLEKDFCFPVSKLYFYFWRWIKNERSSTRPNLEKNSPNSIQKEIVGLLVQSVRGKGE